MGSSLVGDRLGERGGEAGEDLLLMGEQRWAVDDRAGDRSEPLARVGLREYAVLVEDEAPERGQDRHSDVAGLHGVDHRLLELLESVVKEFGLAGEVVVDRLRVDVGLAGDLGDRDGFESALEEELASDVGDQLPSALLLALAETGLVDVSGHALSVVGNGFGCPRAYVVALSLPAAAAGVSAGLLILPITGIFYPRERSPSSAAQDEEAPMMQTLDARSTSPKGGLERELLVLGAVVVLGTIMTVLD